ncbi:MAG: metallophosphoesterase [Candidatus Hydrogenedentales bacterium]|jgi:hypothetical protein
MSQSSFSRRNFLQLSAAGFAGVVLGGKSAFGNGTPPWKKTFTVSNTAAIRVMQFTDLHFFAGHKKNLSDEEELERRMHTVDDLKRHVDNANADLILVTGDFWHENPEGRGPEYKAFAVEQLENLGVPWAFTWGNHDHLPDIAAGHRDLAAAKGSLYCGAAEDGNYVISIEDKSGTALAEIFCLNTKDIGVQEDTRQFIRRAAGADAAKRPMRIAACHIPLQQHDQVWEDKIATGFIGERICFEEEDGSSLNVLSDSGMQAFLCGHDHTNDYSGVMAGVELIYGRSTGYSGYGNDKLPKGAKVYTLDPARKAMEWESLLPDGSTWRPGPDERIDKRS